MITRKLLLAVQLWLFILTAVAVYFFSRGFLLSRLEVKRKSSCSINFENDHISNIFRVILNSTGTVDNCWVKAKYSKAVIILIDALRYDFVNHNKRNKESPFHNKMLAINELVNKNPKDSVLFKFIADPPTTTMQRLKGLTTGSLPTFIDASANFASAAITEDNVIEQLSSLGKKVVFAGDDTWIDLFPNAFSQSFPFPSFNTRDLDTVDAGVEATLKDFLNSSREHEWDILIGHFLGVDHCGHTFGPDHPQMTRKLTEMDDFVRWVSTVIDDTTLMVVMGDHGMTATGDHGGGSDDEVSAALFLFGKNLNQHSSKNMEKVVSQIDLVPTLSLLMGLPIPFSNLGSLIPGLLQPDQEPYAFYLNSFQIMNYIRAYSNQTDQIPAHHLHRFERAFGNIQETAITASRETMRNFVNQNRQFLTKVKSVCKEKWAVFDATFIASGILVGALVLACTVLMIDGIKSTPVYVVYSALAFQILLNMAAFTLDHFNHAVICFNLLPPLALIVYLCATLKTLIAKTLKEVVNNKVNLTNFILMLIYLGCYFSDNGVVNENYITSYLTMASAILLVISGIWNSAKEKQTKGKKNIKMAFVKRILLNRVVVVQVVLLVLFYVVIGFNFLTFGKCREEQINCVTSNYTRPISNIRNLEFVTWRVVLAFLSVGLLPFVLYRWLSTSGNLNGTSLPVVFAKYGPALSAIGICYYWGLRYLPFTAQQNPAINNQLFIVPGVIASILIFTFALLIWQPLCIYIERRAGDPGVINTSGDARTVIYEIYNHMRMNWRSEFSVAKPKHIMPLAYGLGTAYSAAILTVTMCVVLGAILVHTDGLAFPFLAFLFCVSCLVVLNGSRNDCGVVRGVFVLGFLASHATFMLGHQHTFPAIHWEAAFVGNNGTLTNYWVSGALVVINTFSIEIITGFALPLLVIWPLTSSFRYPEFRKKIAGTNQLIAVQKGEFHLTDDKARFLSVVQRYWSVYALFQLLKLMAAMIAAAILRRHLMVWKVFGPRFVFQGMSTLVALFSSFLGTMLVLRIDFAMHCWVDMFQKQQ